MFSLQNLGMGGPDNMVDDDDDDDEDEDEDDEAVESVPTGENLVK